MDQKQLRETLVKMLTEEQAHLLFETSVRGLSPDLIGIQPDGLPYSIWQLVAHIRITQWDIVEFSSNPKHISPEWPAEYWPQSPAPKNKKEWEETIQEIKKDRKRMVDLIKDPENDLLQPFSHGTGQHLLREAILIADHTSYHTGQIVLIRRLLGAWE